MNLYLISQCKNVGYDTYDSAVVAAESEEAARLTHPSIYADNWDGRRPRNGWVGVEDVTARLIGLAAADTPPGVICTSFNAG